MCHHGETEEDKKLACVSDYRRLLKFKYVLQRKLKMEDAEVPNQEAVASILRGELTFGGRAAADPEGARQLYSNPLLSIVESTEEANFEEKMQSGLDRRKIPELVEQSSIKNSIYGTKAMQNLSP